jgi:hypothetical protein
MGKNSGSRSGMKNPDRICESLETIFLLKILEFFDGKIRIRDGKKSDP